MKKSILSLTLALIMVIGLIPATALADEGDTGPDGDYIWKELAGGEVEIITYFGTGGDIIVPDTLNGMPVVGVAGGGLTNPAITGAVLPEGVRYLGDAVFNSNVNLKSVTLPSTLKTMGDAVFASCSGLESIVIPDSVTAMGGSVFSGCTSLEDVTFSGGMASIPGNTFYGCSSLKSFVIPASVTSIGAQAFYLSGIETIDIPGSVKTIGNAVFPTGDLTSVTLHSGLETIGDSAFTATHITSLTIPDTVTSVGAQAFAGCTSLSQLTINGAATSLGSATFGGCLSLNKATILIRTGAIDGSAFSAPFADGIYGLDGTTIQTWANDHFIPFHILCMVSFDASGGSDVAPGYALSGDTVDEPDMPALSGKAFAGWYGNEEFTGDPVSFPYTVSADTTLYAKWVDLTLVSSDADGVIYTGGRVTLTPSLAGGTWDFDSAYFSREDGTFTALKAGASTITYTAGGASTTYDVTIEQSGLPSTGQDFAGVWLLSGAALALGAAGVLARRRRARTSEQ